jgi:hypothetical protein
MKLTKDGDVVELSNQGHIDAFKLAGWTEYTEPEKPKKAPKKGE